MPYAAWYKTDFTGGSEVNDNLKYGRINKTRIPDNITIIPTSLLGQARKMA